jgi:hypothetical protein
VCLALIYQVKDFLNFKSLNSTGNRDDFLLTYFKALNGLEACSAVIDQFLSVLKLAFQVKYELQN